MQHLVYSVNYSVAPIHSELLAITLYYSVINHSFVTTKNIPIQDVITEFDILGCLNFPGNTRPKTTTITLLLLLVLLLLLGLRTMYLRNTKQVS